MHLCNHAANWFMSLGSCLSSCVHWKGDKPDDRCYKSTFFSPCTRYESAETWWFFGGTACIQRKWPQESRPSEQSRVFHSRRMCNAPCLHGNRDEADCRATIPLWQRFAPRGKSGTRTSPTCGSTAAPVASGPRVSRSGSNDASSGRTYSTPWRAARKLP
ncbi:uncharacterized protein LOC144134969 [Amblyomma americanum]